MRPLICEPENAARVLEWIKTRGGLAVWKSIDLGDPGASWTTPVLKADGTPHDKPSWKAGNEPTVITSTDDVQVIGYKEVKRFRVAIQRGSGLQFQLTRYSSHKLRKALDVAGEGATYRFDYDTQNAVILLPENQTTLTEWEKNNVAVS